MKDYPLIAEVVFAATIILVALLLMVASALLLYGGLIGIVCGSVIVLGIIRILMWVLS